MECLDDPFLPKYEVPVYVPPQFSPIIGSRDAKDAQRNVGLLSGLSLQPFVYPPALPSDSSDFSEDQDSYDGVFLHSYFDGNRSHPGYEIFTTAASSNMIDEKYLTKTTSTASESQLRSTLYDQWRKGTIPGRFSTALSFESVSETPQKLDVSATVFYNDSITTNCTEACPLVSNIVRLENAIFQRLSPGNTAMAYLRRMPPIDAVQRLRIIELAISITIGLTTHFLLPSFLRFLVYERARRLRSMMAVMGLGRAQYWFGTYSGLLIQYCSERVLGILIGIAVSIPFYTDNNAVSYIVLFFLWYV